MSTIQINSTFCKDKCSNNYITKKELSTLLIIDSIRQFIINQYTFIFKVAPHENILESLVNGYILFNQHKNTSWSELLSNKLGWELQNIARQGCSNGAIRIQIDEVIRQRPDFAIITPTSYDRIEIPNFDRDKINITNFNPFQIVIDLLLPSLLLIVDLLLLVLVDGA